MALPCLLMAPHSRRLKSTLIASAGGNGYLGRIDRRKSLAMDSAFKRMGPLRVERFGRRSAENGGTSAVIRFFDARNRKRVAMPTAEAYR